MSNELNYLKNTVENPNIDVEKKKIKKFKKDAEAGIGNYISMGTYPYIIFEREKQDIREIIAVTLNNDAASLFNVEQNGKLQTNLADEFASPESEEDWSLYWDEVPDTVNILQKFKLYFCNNTVYKYFSNPDEPPQSHHDFIALYLRTDNFHALIKLNYRADKSPLVLIHITQNGEVGYAYKSLINDMAKISAQFMKQKALLEKILTDSQKKEELKIGQL